MLMKMQDLEREKARANEELKALLDTMLLKPIAGQLDGTRDELRSLLVSWLEEELKRPLLGFRSSTRTSLTDIEERFGELDDRLGTIDDIDSGVRETGSRVNSGFETLSSQIHAVDESLSVTRADLEKVSVGLKELDGRLIALDDIDSGIREASSRVASGFEALTSGIHTVDEALNGTRVDLETISSVLNAGVSLAERHQSELRSLLEQAVSRVAKIGAEGQQSFARMNTLVSGYNEALSSRLGSERQAQAEHASQLLARLDTMQNLQHKLQEDMQQFVRQLSEQESILAAQQRGMTRLQGTLRTVFWSSLIIGLLTLGGVAYGVVQSLPLPGLVTSMPVL